MYVNVLQVTGTVDDSVEKKIKAYILGILISEYSRIARTKKV
jgi:hypothetical protein